MMSAVGEVLEPDGRATTLKLLEILGDVVAMVGGRVQLASISPTTGNVSVHVTTQADAELLAQRLSLDVVTDYEPTEQSAGFMVWSSSDLPELKFTVFCSADLVRPVRAFPASWDDEIFVTSPHHTVSPQRVGTTLRSEAA